MLTNVKKASTTTARQTPLAKILTARSCVNVWAASQGTASTALWVKKIMFLDYPPFKRERQYCCASSPWILFTYFHPVAKNCAELHESGNKNKTSGVFTISPDDEQAFDVLCDQITAGGGWTVFQKRLDGSVNFFRNWTYYKQGFGNLSGEFWLGLDKIHRLTSQTNNKLRVELEDFEGNTAYAEYDTFAVANEGDKYKMSTGDNINAGN